MMQPNPCSHSRIFSSSTGIRSTGCSCISPETLPKPRTWRWKHSLGFHQRPPKTGDGYNPGGWLYRVATNLGLRSIRSYRRREHYELAAGKGIWEAAQEDRPAEILESKRGSSVDPPGSGRNQSSPGRKLLILRTPE